MVDDASTDDSMAVLERYAARSSLVRVLGNERNLGVVDTVNRLLEEATGDWILFEAADDFLLPGAIERSMRLLEAYPQAGLCCGLSRLVDESGVDLGVFRSAAVTDRPRYLTPSEVRRLRSRRAASWFVMGNTATYRRAAVLEAGGLRPELHAYCDRFMSQVVALRHGACFIPEPLGAWRRLEAGFASTWGGDAAVRQRVYDHVEKLMTTEFADVFDARHAAEWRRQAEASDAASALTVRHGDPLARLATRGDRVGRAAQLGLRAGRIGAELVFTVRNGLTVRSLVRERIERRRVRRGI